MLVVRDFRLEKPIQHLILTSYLDCFTARTIRKATSPYPHPKAAALQWDFDHQARTNGAWEAYEPMNAADISTCCSTLSFRHLANTSALQCIGLYLATQTLRLGVKFQPKKVWFLAWFFRSPNFQTLGAPRSFFLWPL